MPPKSSYVLVAALASVALGDSSMCVQSTSEDSTCTKAVHVRVDVSQNVCYSSCQGYNTQSVDTQYSIYSGAVADVAAYFETIFKGESYLTIENYLDSDCTTPSQAIYAGFLADGKCHRFKTGYIQVVQGKDGTMWALVSDVGCEANLYTSYSLYSFKTTQLNNGDCVSPGSGTSFKATFSGNLPAAMAVITGTDSTDTTGSTSGSTPPTTTDVSTATTSAASTPGVVPIVTAMAGFISGSLLLIGA